MSTAGPPTGAEGRAAAVETSRSWRERLRHHGVRALLLLAVATLVTALFPPTAEVSVRRYDWEVGVPAPEDVIADVEFTVPKTAAELQRDREIAMEVVPPTFDYVPAADDSAAARIGALFDQLDSAVAAQDMFVLSAVLEQSSISATPSQVEQILDDDTRGLLRRTAVRASREILPRGVVDARLAVEIITPTVTVREGDTERAAPAEEVLTSRDFYDLAIDMLPTETAPDIAELLRLILFRYVEFSFVPNGEATQLDREAAARSVPTEKAQVLRGQAILRRGQVIGPAEAQWLDAYEGALAELGVPEVAQVELGPLMGAWVLNVMLLAIFGLLVYFNRPEIYGNLRWLLLIALLTAAYFLAAAAIAAAAASSDRTLAEWLPIAFVALPVAVLWDTRMSLVLVLVLGVVSGTLPPFAEYATALVVMAGGAAAAMSARALRRRSQTWVSIALIAGAAGVVLLAHGLATSRDLTEVAQGTAYAAANATVAALLAMGFLWVFELFTRITTDQTLLEWADPTRPLLKRLSLEAPGTYAHTINVANLSEAAAAAIGANGLLCRVGVYYHDVGKMLKPHYFVENQPDARNPHDKLKPDTSADIVREHVTEGARLAREAKVPEVVIDFILEHHGTQRIGYFYERALEEQGEGEAEVDLARFCYPGPKPRSRETAIVMLADSCESAGRAMQEPTPERLRELIDTIVDAKIADGQLDDAPMTLREITRVKEQFVSILTGVIHRRIEYPGTKHLTDAAADDEAAAEGDAEEPEPAAAATATEEPGDSGLLAG